jgi:uncharacterized damage-inducible protein DinB
MQSRQMDDLLRPVLRGFLAEWAPWAILIGILNGEGSPGKQLHPHETVLSICSMCMLEHLRRLFRYDDWANREVMAGLQASGSPPLRSIKLLSHIFSAERLWLERLQQQNPSIAVWPGLTLEQCASQAADLAALWNDYLSALTEAGLAAPITYKNSKGESWTSRVEDILLHVVTHSAHHRGQIATDMRAAGFTPAYTDFIHAVRQGFVE